MLCYSINLCLFVVVVFLELLSQTADSLGQTPD